MVVRTSSIQTYQKDWKEHVERKQDGIFPKLALKYQPVGKRSRGRPKKRDGGPFRGRELRNTGLINLVNYSGRRRRRRTYSFCKYA
jgi:hypothetical protein